MLEPVKFIQVKRDSINSQSIFSCFSEKNNEFTAISGRIYNNSFDTLKIELFETNCNGLFVIKYENILFYEKSDTLLKNCIGNTIFCPFKLDSIVNIPKGKSVDVTFFAENTSDSYLKKYRFNLVADSMGKSINYFMDFSPAPTRPTEKN